MAKRRRSRFGSSAEIHAAWEERALADVRTTIKYTAKFLAEGECYGALNNLTDLSEAIGEMSAHIRGQSTTPAIMPGEKRVRFENFQAANQDLIKQFYARCVKNPE